MQKLIRDLLHQRPPVWFRRCHRKDELVFCVCLGVILGKHLGEYEHILLEDIHFLLKAKNWPEPLHVDAACPAEIHALEHRGVVLMDHHKVGAAEVEYGGPVVLVYRSQDARKGNKERTHVVCIGGCAMRLNEVVQANTLTNTFFQQEYLGMFGGRLTCDERGSTFRSLGLPKNESLALSPISKLVSASVARLEDPVFSPGPGHEEHTSTYPATEIAHHGTRERVDADDVARGIQRST
jgi:hypothetical protein